MPTFNWAESASTAVDRQVRVASTQFGDGYRESGPSGLNPIAQTWRVVFRGCSRAGGDAIEDFLTARVNPVQGLEAFDWWPLWADAAIKVQCESWSRVQGAEPDESDITAVFQKVNLP